MYSRKLSRLSKKRKSKRSLSLLKRRALTPRHAPNVATFGGTRIPMGKFKHKKNHSLVSLESTKKVLDKITPLRNGGKSYTVLNPVTPMVILKQFANPEAMSHDVQALSERKRDNETVRGSYTIVNPVFSTDVLRAYANADATPCESNKIEEKTLELLHVRKYMDGEPNEQIKGEVEAELLHAGHGDERKPYLVRTDSNVSILNHVRTLLRESLDEFGEEAPVKEMPRNVSEMYYRRMRRATRIPIRMKKQNSWEQTNMNMIHFKFNCGCGVVERKSLTF